MFGRPRIAVTGPSKGGHIAWQMTRLCVLRAGGIPIRVTYPTAFSINDFQGVIIGGGSDIHPSEYGVSEAFWPEEEDNYDLKRDALENTLAKAALAKGTPILGICRGAQLLNIIRGGTLLQDTQHFYSKSIPKSPRAISKAKIVKNSALSKIIQTDILPINKLHSQAIDELGDDLRVVAKEENGLIQAIETNSSDFCFGVQWHPEYLPTRNAHQRIFKSLVQASQNTR